MQNFLDYVIETSEDGSFSIWSGMCMQVLPNKTAGHVPALVPQPQLPCPCGELSCPWLFLFAA